MVVPCEYLFAGCFSDDLLAKLLAMALNLPTGMGQKLKYGLQKHAENAKKFPQLSMRVREFLGAASRNRTGTGLTPGDFKFSDGGEKCIILSSKHGYKCNIFCKM